MTGNNIGQNKDKYRVFRIDHGNQPGVYEKKPPRAGSKYLEKKRRQHFISYKKRAFFLGSKKEHTCVNDSIGASFFLECEKKVATF